MKHLLFTLAVGLCFSLCNNLNGQVFTNGTGVTLLVKYQYSDNPCSGNFQTVSATVLSGDSHNFGAPPAGTHYFSALVGIINPTCATGFTTLVLDVSSSSSCNGPELGTFGCPSANLTAEITNQGNFDVEAY